MHIPDGYLGPQTYLAAYGVMLPLWAAAVRRVQRTLQLRQVPLLALGAAFSFLTMMFNVPIPGGTTGHAVGGVLVAILLGPWAACLAVTLALIVQALLFGDGGITALGANGLNMAVIMPWVGWWTYRLLGGSTASPRRRAGAAAVAAYLGLNAAAFTAALMFGAQPHLAHDAARRALYCPYGFGIAIPAMALEHLLVFGLVEAVATGLVVAYVQRSEPALLAAAPPSSTLVRRLVAGVALLVVLTPLGLWLPARLGAGDAWGEWSVQDVAARIGYTPARMEHLASLWRAPMPDYAMPGQAEASVPLASAAYVLSAVLGVAFLAILVGLLRFWLLRRPRAEAHT